MALSAHEEDEDTLREWAPLTDLFQKLPSKTQSGLFMHDLKLTCVDVACEIIALGTGSGVVYCYDRKRKEMQRLRCENSNSPITVIKIISTVDFMLACGNKEGNISIFQIPKIPPDNLPESLKPKNKQVERYTVSEMHKGSISALEWSKNGMKLFSGDTNGIVVLTEIDFYMHICKSVEILNEAYEVVQLSYRQQNLLISTTYRSIVCQKLVKWEVCQVGKKDRKALGRYGGIFYQNGLRPSDVVLYCSRPGLRIWLSDIKGSVLQTLLFKDILNKESPEVPLLNPISSNLKRLKPNKEASFGIVLSFMDDYLVTYNNDVVYILYPRELKIIATISHLRSVLDISINKDEIFVLEGNRSLVRIAFTPEPTYEKSSPPHTKDTFHPIRDFTSRMQTANIISGMPPLFEHQDSIAVINAEEVKETPVIGTQSYTEKVYESYRKLEVFNRISEQEFDDTILFKHGRRKKYDMTTSTSSVSSTSSDERDVITQPTLLTVSMVGALPDLRSPDSIQNDIDEKEKKLADLLCFDSVKIDLSNLRNGESEIDSNSESEVLNETSDVEVVSAEATAVDVPNETRETFINGIGGLKDEIKESVTIKDINMISCNIAQIDTPACRTMPDSWNVFDLSLETNNSPPLNDWEII